MAPRKKTSKRKDETLRVGGSYVAGNVHVKDGEFVGRDKIVTSVETEAELSVVFKPVYNAIEQRPNTTPEEKQEIKDVVKDMEGELKSSPTPNEKFIARLASDLQKMAPDILEVMLASMQSPVAGISAAVRKIIARAAQQSSPKPAQ